MEYRTKEIRARFEKPWIGTEDIFDELLENGFERLMPVRDLIKELKSKGDNYHYRIGTSLYMLIFSRSVEDGLRDDQKYLIIDTIGNDDYEIILRDRYKKYREYRIDDLSDNKLTNLLQTLKGTLID